MTDTRSSETHVTSLSNVETKGYGHPIEGTSGADTYGRHSVACTGSKAACLNSDLREASRAT